MNSPQEPQQKKGGGAGKVLLGCGIVAVVIIVVLVVGGIWMLKDAFTQDPAEIAAITDEIVPGATVPEAYAAFAGIDMFGFKMAMYGPPGMEEGEKQGNMMILASVPAEQEDGIENQVRDAMADKTGGTGTKEKAGTEVIPVGGNDVEFQKSIVTQGEKTMVQYSGVLPASDGRVTMLMFLGPEGEFDRASMEAFLVSIPGEGGEASNEELGPPTPDVGGGDGG